MIDKLKYIRKQLNAHDGELDKIAYEAKVSRRTISNVRHATYEPTLRIKNMLYEYLKSVEGK